MHTTTTSPHLAPVLPFPVSRVDEAAQELTYLAQAAANAPRPDRQTLLDPTSQVLAGLSPTEQIQVTALLLEELRDQLFTVRTYRSGTVDDAARPF